MTRYLLLVLVACGGARVTAPPATGDGDPASAVFGGTAWRMPGTVDHIAFAGDAMIVTSQGGAIARFTRDGKRTVLRDPSSVDIAATALVGTTLILAGESPFAFDTTRAIASPLAVERAFSAIAASNTLAVIPPEGDDPERPLEVVELATGKVLRTLEHSRGYTPTLVSGDRVLAGRHGRAVGIWSMASGKRHRVFGNGGTFALSPDGAHLAVGTFWSGEQALVDIYAVEDGTRTAVVDAACSVGELAFSPDGRRLAWACDDETRVVSVPAGKPVAALAGTGAHVRALAWSPDGAVLAAGGNDNVLYAWDARSWQPLTRVVGTRGEVSELVVAGRYLMSRALGDQSAWLWVTDTKKPAIELGGRGREVHAVATDGDALLIAVRSGDRMALERWSGARRTQASATPPGSFGGWPLVRQVGLLADGGAW